ncbi:MAG: carbohydrate ABC transporter permease [Sphaerochaeta sp.]
MRKNNISYAKYGYLFSIPFVLAFLLFNLYPTIYTIIIGFTDLRGLGRTTFKFLEDPFQNYKSILNNATFLGSLKTTFIIWIFNFIPQVLLALLLTAWFTNRRLKVKAQGLFKVLIYMPNIITAATIAILFNSLTGYPKGPINDLLMKLGILDAPSNFHVQSGTARGVVSFIQFWMWYGHSMIILIAGVLGINPTLFEAAEVDGATPAQIFFKITLPRLKTILLYVLVTGLIGGIQMFDIPRLYLWGGPDNATLTSSVFIYNQAFAGSYLYNRASAASMIVFIIILVLSGIMFYSMRDRAEIKLRKFEKNRLKEEKRMGAVR